MIFPSQEVASESRSWSNLHIDIIHLIVSHLSLADYPSFAGVCKEWCSVVPLVYPAHQSPLLINYMMKEHGVCRYYSPYFNKTFVVDFPFDFSRTHFLYSKDGWMLLSRGSEFIFVNPVTGMSHQLQGEEDDHFGSAAFSSSPLSSDCLIFIIYCYGSKQVSIRTIRGENWANRMSFCFDCPVSFDMNGYSNPVFLHGQFYCLGIKGNLGVFNPQENTWTILDKPEKPNICSLESFLVEVKGNLMSVFIDELKRSMHLFRLNQKGMEWEKVESLNDQSLFVGHPMSISVTITGTRMMDKLCLPTVQGVPEVVEAYVKTSEKQTFFVPKSCTTYLGSKQEPKQTSNGGITYYDLESGELFNDYRSREYMNSIWFESKHEDMAS